MNVTHRVGLPHRWTWDEVKALEKGGGWFYGLVHAEDGEWPVEEIYPGWGWSLCTHGLVHYVRHTNWRRALRDLLCLRP